MNRLAYRLLTDGLEGVEVAADLDANSVGDTPMVTFTVLNQGQFEHGLWRVILLLNVFCEASDTDDLLSTLYPLILSWEEPGMGVLEEEKLGVQSIQDSNVFDLVTQAVMNGKHILQFSGQFELIVQDWS